MGRGCEGCVAFAVYVQGGLSAMHLPFGLFHVREKIVRGSSTVLRSKTPKTRSLPILTWTDDHLGARMRRGSSRKRGDAKTSANPTYVTNKRLLR